MSSGKNFFSEAKALFELPFSSAAAIPLPPPSLSVSYTHLTLPTKA